MVLPVMLSPRSRCWIYAGVCLVLAWIWLYGLVATNYGGNWTGLFCVGRDRALPPAPEFAEVYQQSPGQGFDGQYYLMMAHDPWLEKGYWRYIDWPGLRYLRILEPALAWMIPLPGAAAFILMHLLFLGFGAAGVGLMAVERGRSAGWTFAFLLLPAVWISLDRMTVDLPFLAVFVWVCYRPGWWPLAVLCLVRETGLVALGALVGWHIFRRQWAEGAQLATAAVPFGLWAVFVAARFDMKLWMWWPERIPYARTLEDWQQLATGRMAGAVALEALALGGLLAAMGWALWRMKEEREKPEVALGALFAGMGLYLLALGDWSSAYDYGRVLSPLLATVVLQGIEQGRMVLLAPAALISARVGVQQLPQLEKLLAGLL